MEIDNTDFFTAKTTTMMAMLGFMVGCTVTKYIETQKGTLFLLNIPFLALVIYCIACDCKQAEYKRTNLLK